MHSRQMASTSEIWELSSLAHKLINFNDLLAAELDGCRQNIGKHKNEVDDCLKHSFGLKLHIQYWWKTKFKWGSEKRRYEEEYRNLIRLLESTHLDNMKVLKTLISTREDQALVFGDPKARVVNSSETHSMYFLEPAISKTHKNWINTMLMTNTG